MLDRVTIITGSGSGIGRAIALRFAKTEYAVVVNDIVQAAGEQVLSEIERGGRERALRIGRCFRCYPS